MHLILFWNHILNNCDLNYAWIIIVIIFAKKGAAPPTQKRQKWVKSFLFVSDRSEHVAVKGRSIVPARVRPLLMWAETDRLFFCMAGGGHGPTLHTEGKRAHWPDSCLSVHRFGLNSTWTNAALYNLMHWSGRAQYRLGRWQRSTQSCCKITHNSMQGDGYDKD